MLEGALTMRLCGKQFPEVRNAAGRRDFRGRNEAGLGTGRLSVTFGWKMSRACPKGETREIWAWAVKPDHADADSSSVTSPLSGRGKVPDLTKPQLPLWHLRYQQHAH